MRVIELKMGSFFPNIDCTGRVKKGKKGGGGRCKLSSKNVDLNVIRKTQIK